VASPSTQDRALPASWVVGKDGLLRQVVRAGFPGVDRFVLGLGAAEHAWL
jgi:hypothetical protein